jgi:uncharacterized protein with HEPN domain
MSKYDDLVSLRDMLSHAREAVDLLGGSSREELAGDRVLQLALTRLVEIIGEAANRVSQLKQAHRPEIPWLQIIGMRNRLYMDTMSSTSICSGTPSLPTCLR